MTPKAQEVLAQIALLRKLQKDAGLYSGRTQRKLLLSLTDDELAAVALELSKLEQTGLPAESTSAELLGGALCPTK